MTEAQGPIVVTGGSGQVASALAVGAAGAATGGESTDGPRILRLGRPGFDFDRPETILPALREAAPSLVVNAAAYTAVDRAETEADAALRANRDGPAALAAYCAAAGIPLIHISTDYVFDGRKGAPYAETDPTNPTGVYGASKLAGEQAVLASCPRAIILRTSWVYAESGRNFVLTMLNARTRTDRLRVVADQIGCPTPAPDLARVILQIIARIRAQGWDDRYAGQYHAAGEGWTSWHGLATAVFEEAARHGMAVPLVEPIATADWPTPARRPADSRLDCTRLAETFGLRLPPWRASLSNVIDRVFQQHQTTPGPLPGR
jgi:dTDP-4-dehydrorhamnose reductase